MAARTLDRTKSAPLWQQLQEELLTRLAAGEFTDQIATSSSPAPRTASGVTWRVGLINALQRRGGGLPRACGGNLGRALTTLERATSLKAAQ
jgi:hypothetical protein